MKMLITGSPGVGKTTVGKLLKEKGYGFIDIDEHKELKYWKEKKTHKKVVFEGNKDLDWYDKHDVNLDREALDDLLSKQEEENIFVSGVTSNITDTLDFFDKIFLLKTDLETLRNRRLGRRDRVSRTKVSKSEIEQGFKEHKEFQNEMLKHGAIPINTTTNPEETTQKILNHIT